MKPLLIALIVGIVIHHTSQAQSTRVIRVKGGISEVRTIPIPDRYRFDQFRDGSILFQNGTSGTARFNYNVLLGEMQFIDSRGDTLAVADQPTVQLVGIGNTVFWYDQRSGYLEIIGDYTSVKLAVKQGLKTAKNEKLAAYGQSSGSSSITNYQFYLSDNTSVNKLDPKGDLLLIVDKTYFIIDQNKRSNPINKANLLKVFGKHREQVLTYLTGKSIDFKQETDVKELLTYCSSLL
ncbi:hypothetical protein EXU85_17760 [Spirosoma sp. KCTC 42546]|uniref:hypothetical protein n=1 Tax=Spirosoma sp. KCTC 42546 TaxID=2520506 RepID=UPI00115AEC53|nr:hypothetical protein [Spirosoma sp. KCTC 42546]QDK80348.1 hypothetical protein EXU85_17760 [Spirosoma sp. KCTC 42546]